MCIQTVRIHTENVGSYLQDGMFYTWQVYFFNITSISRWTKPLTKGYPSFLRQVGIMKISKFMTTVFIGVGRDNGILPYHNYRVSNEIKSNVGQPFQCSQNWVQRGQKLKKVLILQCILCIFMIQPLLYLATLTRTAEIISKQV